MTSLQHPRERKIAMLSHIPTDALAAQDWRVARASKQLGARILDREGDGFASKPIAAVIAVAVHEVDFDAGVKQVGDCFDEVAALDVGGGLEVVVDGHGEGGEIHGDAEGGEHPGVVEVAVHVWLC